MNIRPLGPWTALVSLCLLLTPGHAYALGEAAQGFTLDGELFSDAAGRTPLNDTGVLTLQIMNPAQTCVLYEETQTFDTTNTKGFFHAIVGSAVGAPKRNGSSGLDSGHPMALVYSNVNSGGIAGRAINGGACSYVPASGDARYVRVTVLTASDNNTRVLSPNMALDAAPSAVVAERAETLQGLAPAAFLQLETTGNPNLTQANLESIFQNYSNLNALVSGTSPAYMQSGSAGGALLPQPTTPPTGATAAATEGQIWYDPASHSIRYSDGSSVQSVGAAGSGITSLSVGTGLGSTSGTTITTAGQTISVDVGTAANKIIQLNGSAQLPAVDGSQLKNLNASALTSGTVGVPVNTTGAVTTTAYVSTPDLRAGVVKLSNGTNYVQQRAPAGLTGDYALTWPVALPASGSQILTSDASGQLSWTALNNGLVSNQAALANGSIWIGDVTGKAQARAPSGDVTVSNSGAFKVTAIQNVGVNATAPTASGQVLRYDLTSNTYKPAFVAMTDLRSTTTGTTTFGTSCSASQTLTFNAVTDTMSCQDIALNAGQLNAGAVGTAALANDSVTSAKLNSTGVAINRLLITNPTTGETVTYATCATNEILKFGATGWTCASVASLSPVTSVAGKTGAVTLNAADVGGLGTAALLDHGTAAGQAVRLDASARLPLVDGSQLTNVNAGALQTYPVAAIAPSANQVLKWNGSAWLGAADLGLVSLTGDVTNASAGSSATTIADSVVTSRKVNAVGIATNRVLITDATDGSTIKYADTCAIGQILKWTSSGWTCGADLGTDGYVTSVGAGTGLTGGPITSSGTLSVDVGTAANKILQLNGSAQIPAVDAALLYNVRFGGRTVATTAPLANQTIAWNASTTQWEPWTDAGGSVTNVATGNGLLGGPFTTSGTLSVDTGTTANKILQLNSAAQIPALDGSLLYAVKLGTRQVATTAPLAGQNLTWNASTIQWEPATASGGTVSSVAAGTGLLGGTVTTSGTLSVDVGATAGKIVQENANAQIVQPAGSMSLPSYSFVGSLGTGLFASATDQLSVATAGTTRLSVLANGNVGIGTTAPLATLQVASNTPTASGAAYFGDGSNSSNTISVNGRAFFGYDAGGNAVVQGSSAKGINFNVNNATFGSGTAMNLGTSGNLGIGTTSGSYPLDVYAPASSGTNVDALRVYNSGAQAVGSAVSILFSDSGAGSNDIGAKIQAITENATGGSRQTGFAFLTTNQISSTSPTERLRITGNGNVGIGTSAPLAGLDIATTGNFGSAIILPRDSTANRPTTPVNGMIRYNTTTSKFEAFENAAWANVISAGGGGATTFPLLANPIGTAAAPAYSFTANANTGMYSPATNQIALSTNGTAALSILASGNVGIGSATPTTKLDVNGSAKILLGSPDAFLIVDSSGNSPGSLKYLYGQTYFTSNLASTGGAFAMPSYYSGGSYIRQGSGQIEFAVMQPATTTLNTAMVVSVSGKVGIGSTSPASPLDVVGDVNTTTKYLIAGTAVCTSAGCNTTSDIRLKQNVRPLESSLDKVLKLNGVSWDWINKEQYGAGDQVGLIAQELEKVYPEVVRTDANTGIKTVGYGNLVGPLIESIKTLYAKLMGHDERLTKLEQENVALKAEVDQSHREVEDLKARMLRLEQR